MIFAFCDEASKQNLTIKDELFKYLIKARRHKIGDVIYLRNVQNSENIYIYELKNIEPRSAKLELIEAKELNIQSSKKLHIGWCIVEQNSIEKVLPTLCEMGVAKISFVYCKRTQKNFKIDLKRFKRIVSASMQQSGRSDFMEFYEHKSVAEFLKLYPNTKVLDFGGESFESNEDELTVLVGCEGGFDESERELFKSVFSLKTPMVLKSESAVVAISSKVLC